VQKVGGIELENNFDTKKGVYARLSICDPSGNWCGHDKDNPRFFYGKLEHKNRPIILEQAKQAAKTFYDTQSKLLQCLKGYRNGSKRKIRSESREAIASVIQVLMHYLDLASLRFVMPTAEGGLFCPTFKFIAKQAGIGEKRLSRVINLLKRANFIDVHERYKKEGDKFIGLASVKRVSPLLFLALGISSKDLDKQRKQASKALKARERARRQEEYSLYLSQLSFNNMLSKNDKQQVTVLNLYAMDIGNENDLVLIDKMRQLQYKAHNPKYH
jgi:hypothetical protein